MEDGLFALVAEVARSLCQLDVEDLHSRSHKYGTKVWFGPAEPSRLHFEAQLMRRRHIDGGEGMALEIGFHAEERDPARNIEVLAHLTAHERLWRKALGPEAEAGEFFDADKWRRLSEAWLEPEIDDEGIDFEIGSRLADYINAIQPLLNTLV